MAMVAYESGTLSILNSCSATIQQAHDVSSLISDLSDRPIIIDLPELCRMADRNVVYIFESKSRIVGMAWLVIMDLPQGYRFLIESVAVSSEHRRKGIGRMLIQALLDEARKRGGGHVSLTCNPTRVEAQNFYRDLGFSVANTNVLRIAV